MRKYGNYILPFILGGIIWYFIGLITGEIEPWDADKFFYYHPVLLLIAGIILGFLYPRENKKLFIGLIAGQFALLIIMSEAGPLILVGVLFLTLFSLPALLGMSIGSYSIPFIKKIFTT